MYSGVGGVGGDVTVVQGWGVGRDVQWCRGGV